jgi:hypothetical protein
MDDARPITRLGEIGNEETFAESMQRKERELIQRIAAVRGLLTPLESELGQVRKAMQAIGVPSSTLASSPFGSETRNSLDEMVAAASPATGVVPALPQINNNALFGMAALGVVPFTIKQMIVHALRDHFHGGATPAELRDYMHTAYGRQIDRNSISPQLARLREEGVVEQTNALLSDGKWKITPAGRRYGRTLLGETGE